MAIIDRQWLNANEGRNYPITDVVTRVADDGVVLPNTFLVDAYIRVPYTQYKQIYVSAASVGPGVVSVVFSAYDSPSVVPLGAVTVSKPVTPYKNYTIDALTEGVGGWVMFGSAVKASETFNLKFSSYTQSQLLDRCVNVYDIVPVSGIRKKYASSSLTGIVRLAGRVGSTQVVSGQRTINGEVKDVALIQVIATGNITDKMHALAGVCGHRPGELTCNKRVLTAVNNVTPDCNGNIDLEFTNGIIVGSVANGLVLDYPKGLADSCVKIDPNKLPSETEDICHPSSEPVPPEPSSSSYVPSSIHPLDPEYCEAFSTDPTELVVKSGSFIIDSARWKSTGQSVSNYARDDYRTFQAPYKYAVKGIIRPSLQGEGHLCFDVNSDSGPVNIYKFFGVAVDGFGDGTTYANKFFYGLYNSNSPAGGIGYGHGASAISIYTPTGSPTLNPNIDYDVYIYAEEAGGTLLLTFDVIWSGGSFHRQTATNLFQTYSSKCGLGAVVKDTYFDFFGANCESSSSLVP